MEKGGCSRCYPETTSKQPDASSGRWRMTTMSAFLKAALSRSVHRSVFMVTQIETTVPAAYLMWWGSASPQAKCSFYPRFAIIRSSWGCTDVWRALMECQRKGQTMQILFVQPNLKSHKGNYPFAKTVPASLCHFFFFSRPQLLMSLTKTFSATPAEISEQGGATWCFTPPAEMFVGGHNDFTY